MNIKIKCFLFYVLILISSLGSAQQVNLNSVNSRTRDSLSRILNTPFLIQPNELGNSVSENEVRITYDTTRINALNDLAKELQNSDLDSSIALSTEALQLAVKLFSASKKGDLNNKLFQVQIAKSFHLLGVFNFFKANYPLSLSSYFKSLKIWESLNIKSRISSVVNNIASVYTRQGDYPKALEYYAKALQIAKELGINDLVSSATSNIGAIYSAQGKDTLALEYLFKALKMDESVGDRGGMAINLSNIGSILQSQASSAIFQKNFVAGDSLYKKALNYYLKSLAIDEEFGDNNGMSSSLGAIGSLYIELKQYKKAEDYLHRALEIAKEIKALDVESEIQQVLSELFEKSGQPDKALMYYRNHIATRDSIFNKENTENTVRTEMNFEFEKKQAIEKAEQEKLNAIALQEKQKQKIILILVLCFLLFVIVFAFFMYNRWRVTQKQNKIIEYQKEQIVESINYSKRIQNSLLPSIADIKANIPSVFVFYEPKNIVSGDFYFFKQCDNYSILACVDCTGHGVPGAFMSTLGSLLLDKIVNDKTLKPSEILIQLNNEIIRILHQQAGGELQDGMDLSICLIDKYNSSIEYSGARNGIIVVTNNEAKRYKANPLPVGGNYMKKGVPIERNFKTESIALNSADWVFMYTDGFIEQIDGTENQPMNYEQFETLLINTIQLKADGDKTSLLKSELAKWSGSNEQTDDVLLIGFNLSKTINVY